ncbi:MAG TPA: hypothetical protein VMM78_14245 [Thermomicrobiales bacterium]|nr:hypothetical protein [Thermomicrobiales bacterium]
MAIRTVLSLALDVELEGRRSWKHQREDQSENPILTKEEPGD